MAVYLLSWDPMKWDWRTIKEQSEQVARGAPLVRQWSCGSNRRIFSGDTVYFIRQGREPRGIFARGEVVRGSYEATNVDVQDANRNRSTLIVDVRFTALENAVDKVVLPRQALTGGALGKFIWDIRESGAKLPDAVAAALEQAWQAATGKGTSEQVQPASSPVKPVPAAPETSPAKPEAVEKAAKPAPAAAGPAEQERLKQEREERLQKIKTREQEERRKRAASEQQGAAAAADLPLTPERRNEVLVQNYFIMLDAELQGELYSKADHRNRIMQELGETDAKAVDLAHRHISAVLAETGLPFADSFPPAGGFDAALEKAVQVFIEGNPELVEALWIEDVPLASSIPVELDDAKAHWVATPEASGFRPSSRAAWHPAGVNEIDYRVREAGNRNLATAGERFVLAFERARLREAGMKDSVDRVAWQSQTFGDSFGYDVRSLDDDGSERLICVKTTNFGARFPFTLTYRELERARENKAHFHVYRVFRFSRGAKLFIIPAKRLLQETPEPIEFRSWV
ncbi:MAG TPA: DUF3883 domain-containing protein [Gammaproteobacteria bacterium]